MRTDLNYETFCRKIKNRIFVRLAMFNTSWRVEILVDGGSAYGHFVVKQDNHVPIQPPETKLLFHRPEELWDILAEWPSVAEMWIEDTNEIVVVRINGHMQEAVGIGHPVVLQILAMTLSELSHQDEANAHVARLMNERLCHLINNVNMGSYQYGGRPIRPFRT